MPKNKIAKTSSQQLVDSYNAELLKSREAPAIRKTKVEILHLLTHLESQPNTPERTAEIQARLQLLNNLPIDVSVEQVRQELQTQLKTLPQMPKLKDPRRFIVKLIHALLNILSPKDYAASRNPFLISETLGRAQQYLQNELHPQNTEVSAPSWTRQAGKANEDVPAFEDDESDNESEDGDNDDDDEGHLHIK